MKAYINVQRSTSTFSVHIRRPDKRHRDQNINYGLERFRGIGERYHEPWLCEFLELATALYAADRIVGRPHECTRSFVVDFPVSRERRERWEAAKGTLRALLLRTTGDDIELRFSDHDPASRLGARLPLALEFQSPVRVALLSDGLDSAAGAALRLAATTEPFSFVSVITKSIRDDRIARVRDRLKKRFSAGRIIPHCLDVSLADPERNGENTQRFRTTLSIVAGLTIAAAAGSDELELFENGVGILNLPAPNIQLPYESSQVLSPANVPMWRELAQLLLGHSVTIQYPFRWYTKGELCSTLNGALAI